MKKKSLIINLFAFTILTSISSCKKNNKIEIDKIENDKSLIQSNEIAKKNTLDKTLFFDEPTNNESAFKLVFEGNMVDVYREGSAGEILWNKKLQFIDGKIISEDGRTDWLELTNNSLRSYDGEEESFYPLNTSKSSSSIEEVLNQSDNNEFQGQTLKNGEKIIKINWDKEIQTNYSRDMSYSGSRYASKSLIVPNGKKWILLYINEDFTFESGQVVGSVPDLFIDNTRNEIGNRRFSDENNINLSKAKDENIKTYSGSTIKAISSRTNGNGPGDNYIEYKGEMWFLEIND